MSVDVDSFPKSRFRSRGTVLALCGLLAAVAGAGAAGESPAAARAAGEFPAGRGASPIAVENHLRGTPGWELSRPALHHETEGYLSAASVEPGDTLLLHAGSTSDRVSIDVYRLGWYGGVGARKELTLRGVPAGPRPVPGPRDEDGFIACDWPVTARIAVGEGWVTGVYLLRLTGSADGTQSFVPFVVRESSGARGARRSTHRAPLLVQCSVTTWQAYNNWGGKSLYDFNSDGGERAVRVSFDRPYASSPEAAAGAGAGELLSVTHGPHRGGWEYPFIRWLERNGYDVAYATNLDVHAGREPADGRRAILLVGHDEYWTRAMRDQLTRARDRGVHLGVFSSNTGYWQIRLEPGAGGARDRVIFCAKEPERDPVYDTDRDRDLTVRFRNLHPPRPEVELIGMMLSGADVDGAFRPAPGERGHWVYEGTRFREADSAPAPHLLGYEVDRAFEGDSTYGRFSPAGLVRLAHARLGTAKGDSVTAETTLYTAASGAMVFAAGTNQWAWGLDDWGAPALRPAAADPGVERITRNVLEAFLRGRAPPPSRESPR